MISRVMQFLSSGGENGKKGEMKKEKDNGQASPAALPRRCGVFVQHQRADHQSPPSRVAEDGVSPPHNQAQVTPKST